MSKRRIANDIGELSDEILNDLTHSVRLQVLLEARAEQKEGWIDRLVETCPKREYRGPDHAFTVRNRLSHRIMYKAVYDLHTTYLHYQLVCQKQQYTRTLDYERDKAPSEEFLQQAAERAHTTRELFISLYMSYHAYQRFATEVLGVDIETLLSPHPDGAAVLETVIEVVDDQTEIRLAESYIDETFGEDSERAIPCPNEEDDQRTILDELVDCRYEALTDAWQDTIANSPG